MMGRPISVYSLPLSVMAWRYHVFLYRRKCFFFVLNIDLGRLLYVSPSCPHEEYTFCVFRRTWEFFVRAYICPHTCTRDQSVYSYSRVGPRGCRFSGPSAGLPVRVDCRRFRLSFVDLVAVDAGCCSLNSGRRRDGGGWPAGFCGSPMTFHSSRVR